MIPRFDCFDYVRPKFACLNKAVVKRDSAEAVDHPRRRPVHAVVVCLSVCPSVTSRCCIETTGRIDLGVGEYTASIGVAFAWPIMDEHDVVHKPEVDNVSQRRRRRTESIVATGNMLREIWRSLDIWLLRS